MFGILENHVNAFVLQNDFVQMYYILVAQLGAKLQQPPRQLSRNPEMTKQGEIYAQPFLCMPIAIFRYIVLFRLPCRV